MLGRLVVLTTTQIPHPCVLPGPRQLGQFVGRRAVRVEQEGRCRVASSWLRISDVEAELGETATLGMVQGASSWSAGQTGRLEPCPAVCGSIYAGVTGVLDTFIFTSSSFFFFTETPAILPSFLRLAVVCVAGSRRASDRSRRWDGWWVRCGCA